MRFTVLAIAAILTLLTGFRALSFPVPGVGDVSVLRPVQPTVRDVLTAVQSDRETGTVSDQTLAKARALARIHPLDPLPYAALQLRAADENNPEAADRAAQTALDLQPRSRAARMHRANRYLDVQDYSAAIAEVSRLAEIDDGGLDGYVGVLISLSRLPAAKPAIVEALATEPRWKRPFVEAIATQSPDFDFIEAVIETQPERKGLLIQRLADAGLLDRAYLTFIGDLPPQTPLTVPYDRAFEGLAGAGPFNWAINPQYTQIEPGKGLFVTYFGRGGRLLAKQVFPLVGGSYDVEIGLSGTVKPDAGQYGIAMACARSGEQFLQYRLPDTAFAEGRATIGFDHLATEDGTPPCSFVSLSIWAEPGAFPRATEFHILGVNLKRAEGA